MAWAWACWRLATRAVESSRCGCCERAAVALTVEAEETDARGACAVGVFEAWDAAGAGSAGAGGLSASSTEGSSGYQGRYTRRSRSFSSFFAIHSTLSLVISLAPSQ